jgi:hypothetical protein
MRDHQDLTWGQKGAVFMFKKRFFNKKMRPLKYTAICSFILAVIALKLLAVPHLFWLSVVFLLAELFAFYAISFREFQPYFKRVINSKTFKEAYARERLKKCDEYLEEHYSFIATIKDELRKEYYLDKTKSSTNRFIREKMRAEHLLG